MQPPSARRNAPATAPKAPRNLGLAITLLGFLVFSLGAEPRWFGLDRSPGVGFLQIAFMLFGLGLICAAGAWAVLSLWSGRSRTIISDTGLRLIAAGYVIAFFAGAADLIGFGSQTAADPYFGTIQAAGVVAGEVIIAVGFLMIVPYGRADHDASGVSPH